MTDRQSSVLPSSMRGWACRGTRLSPGNLVRLSPGQTQREDRSDFPVSSRCCGASVSARHLSRDSGGVCLSAFRPQAPDRPLSAEDQNGRRWSRFRPWKKAGTPGHSRMPPWPDASLGRCREDEWEACVASECQMRQENWGGCWRRGRRPAGL